MTLFCCLVRFVSFRWFTSAAREKRVGTRRWKKYKELLTARLYCLILHLILLLLLLYRLHLFFLFFFVGYSVSSCGNYPTNGIPWAVLNVNNELLTKSFVPAVNSLNIVRLCGTNGASAIWLILPPYDDTYIPKSAGLQDVTRRCNQSSSTVILFNISRNSYYFTKTTSTTTTATTAAAAFFISNVLMVVSFSLFSVANSHPSCR